MSVQIDILCTSNTHPVNAWLERWADGRAQILRASSQLAGGDFLFLVSCSEIIPARIRELYRYVLAIHASDLPKGRGWPPHVWDVLRGASKLTVSLLTAAETVDTGDIWQQVELSLEGTELYDEINDKLFQAELWLMDWALSNCDRSAPARQVGVASIWPRRTPEHSRVHPEQTLGEVFDLLRICDPERFPAYLEHRGAKYLIDIRRAD